MPQQCPWKKSGNSFCVYANGRLRRRKRLFGLTQTVARRLRSPCCNGTCTVFGRGEFPIRNVSNEAKELSERSKEGIKTKRKHFCFVLCSLFRTWPRGRATFSLGNENKQGFILHFARFFVLDQEVELLLPKGEECGVAIFSLDNKNKKNTFLFCIVLAFSYLRDKILNKAQKWSIIARMGRLPLPTCKKQ